MFDRMSAVGQISRVAKQFLANTHNFTLTLLRYSIIIARQTSFEIIEIKLKLNE
ncbi:hypothetical protein PGB90_004916 [Kerria lacca]